MSEEASRFWSMVFGGVTAIGLVCGGIYTVVQYFHARSQDATNYNLQVATAQLEAKKPFYSKHLDLCTEAATAAATIAATTDPQKKKVATEDFWRLYWGPLSIAEEDEVARAMIDFGQCLNDPRCPQDLRRRLSLALAHKCRCEISKHFDLGLPAPVDKPADAKNQSKITAAGCAK